MSHDEYIWLTSSDPLEMISATNRDIGNKLSRRIENDEFRYYACAVIRAKHREITPNHIEYKPTLVAELYAADRISFEAMRAASDDSHYQTTLHGVSRSALSDSGLKREKRAELLREIIGNPFYHLECDWVQSNDIITLLHSVLMSIDNKIGICIACSGEGCSGNIGYSDEPLLRCDGSGERRLYTGTADNVTMFALADALEEAGCQNSFLLDHLRLDKAQHYCGCWALRFIKNIAER